MARTRPIVLSIAGFDPCGGAGLLADVKTFEANKCYGVSACTAITFQTEYVFQGIDWLSEDQITDQINLLLSTYSIDTVKIGIVPSLQILRNIVEILVTENPKMKIVWDPVLKASTGFDFHQLINMAIFEEICKKLYLVTPNWPEISFLYPKMNPLDAGLHLSKFTNVYIKGGHHPDLVGLDHLFLKNQQGTKQFKTKKISEYPKHGSGCVFSSALAAMIAKGYPLQKSCVKAKTYIENFLNSNVSKLGWHKI